MIPTRLIDESICMAAGNTVGLTVDFTAISFSLEPTTLALSSHSFNREPFSGWLSSTSMFLHLHLYFYIWGRWQLSAARDVNETLHDETETLMSRDETETFHKYWQLYSFLKLFFLVYEIYETSNSLTRFNRSTMETVVESDSLEPCI